MANRVDPEQTLYFAAYDLGLHMMHPSRHMTLIQRRLDVDATS